MKQVVISPNSTEKIFEALMQDGRLRVQILLYQKKKTKKEKTAKLRSLKSSANEKVEAVF